MKGRVITILGPTASGKTALAVRLAERFGSSVISGDAFQVYRGMDIGTAKPTAQERALVPHHMLDVADPTEAYAVADYAVAAEQVIAQILSRGRVPILVGGTGLWLDAVVRGHGFAPGQAGGEVRRELEEHIAVCLGGRVAEQLVLGDISTGASSDIQKASHIARDMVTKYGMSEKLGPITYGSDDSNPFLGKEMGHISNYSEQTASEIDEEIQSIISTAYQKTEQILRDHIDELHRLAGVLYEKEKIDGVEFQQVMDGNLLPSGMAAQALGQEPQAALPQDGGDADQPQEDAGAPEQD